MDSAELVKKPKEDENIWVEFGRLSIEHNAINLGVGFPDFLPPSYLTKALIETALSTNISLHNYTRGWGHLRLVNVLSKLFSKFTGRDITPLDEILVTIGADEALYCTMMAFVNPGDEVIIIEPFFSSYEYFVMLAGGIPVYAPLTLKAGRKENKLDSDWILDPEILASKFNSKTKAIIVNTPNNPTGKVFTREELEIIADIAKKWDVLVLMDEVYEWLIYDGREHFRMVTLPGMWERTITVGSAGKTFSATGWKLGWAYGCSHLLSIINTVHQNFVGSCPTPLQEAVAIGLEIEIRRLDQPECYFSQLVKQLESKRNKMVKILEDLGMTPLKPEGGYFILAKFTDLGNKLGLSDEKLVSPSDFCRWLIVNKRVSLLPLTIFCKTGHKFLAENYLRICFAKTDETIESAERNLRMHPI